MFLPFISQVISYLNTPAGAAVVALLIRAAEDYPFGVVYPLKTFLASNPSSADAAQVARVLDRHVPLVKSFIQGLDSLLDPHLVLGGWVKQLQLVLGKKEIDKEVVRKKFDEIKEKLRDKSKTPGAKWKTLRDEALKALHQVRNEGEPRKKSKKGGRYKWLTPFI